MMLAREVNVSGLGLIGGDVLIDISGIQPVTLAASGYFSLTFYLPKPILKDG